MKFVDCDFVGKHDVRKSITREIFIACRESIHKFDELNMFLVEDYIHILIEETEYNSRGHYFYEKETEVKINLKVFKNVAIEYILEHIDDFLLCKYR
ncbi:hypothetical protein [Methanobrevibacter sp. V74]|uniref:hypothetical protein n=1 Tax=Methanobrevibacter sp. V74 TaxID=3064279 RepID=UPI002732661F|nr:hypothetical protein [Methanobrevibacter sp. V74]